MGLSDTVSEIDSNFRQKKIGKIFPPRCILCPRSRGSFTVKVGLHQGSVSSPLLFVIVMEMISRQLRAGLPLELLFPLGIGY